MRSVAVFCGSSPGKNSLIRDEARKLGKYLANRQIKLVYGAAKIGIMGEVAGTVIEHGGYVIGIIPDFLKKKEVVMNGITELITTENMHDRKIIMYERSDGFIILPGGFGTLDEFFEITTWGQLGLHTKPIGILNTDGFYDSMLSQFRKMVETGFLKQENLEALIISDTIEDLFDKMNRFKPLPVPKWLKKEDL